MWFSRCGSRSLGQRRIWSFHVVQQRTAKKCTKNYYARAQPLFCSLNFLFSDVLIAFSFVFCAVPIVQGRCRKTHRGWKLLCLKLKYQIRHQQSVGGFPSLSNGTKRNKNKSRKRPRNARVTSTWKNLALCLKVFLRRITLGRYAGLTLTLMISCCRAIKYKIKNHSVYYRRQVARCLKVEIFVEVFGAQL